MPLSLDLDLIKRWVSIAEDPIPMKSHVFDANSCSLKAGFSIIDLSPTGEIRFQVLNQLLLPAVSRYIEVKGVDDGHRVIKSMIVRGAPLIATVGMLSLVVEMYHSGKVEQLSSAKAFVDYVHNKCEFLISARPTAINISNAVHQLKKFVGQLVVESADKDCCVLRDRVRDYLLLEWQALERRENDALIRNSVAAIVAKYRMKLDAGEKLTVMTICNTGSLATSSFGTALGVIYHLHKLNLLDKAIALETRPYNQGSRLTAYELMEAKIPFQLITDSMAAYSMKHHHIDAVLVGADQVARNGDTANKIGTYMLGVLSHFHQVPFYVVTIESGEAIVVEQRPASELTIFNGKETAPSGCPAWNPAFDMTPASLITGILTERGCFSPAELGDGLFQKNQGNNTYHQ